MYSWCEVLIGTVGISTYGEKMNQAPLLPIRLKFIDRNTASLLEQKGWLCFRIWRKGLATNRQTKIWNTVLRPHDCDNPDVPLYPRE